MVTAWNWLARRPWLPPAIGSLGFFLLLITANFWRSGLHGWISWAWIGLSILGTSLGCVWSVARKDLKSNSWLIGLFSSLFLIYSASIGWELYSTAMWTAKELLLVACLTGISIAGYLSLFSSIGSGLSLRIYCFLANALLLLFWISLIQQNFFRQPGGPVVGRPRRRGFWFSLTPDLKNWKQ